MLTLPGGGVFGCVVAGLTSMATCNYKLTNQFVMAVVIHGAVVDCTIVMCMGIYSNICRQRFITYTYSTIVIGCMYVEKRGRDKKLITLFYIFTYKSYGHFGGLRYTKDFLISDPNKRICNPLFSSSFQIQIFDLVPRLQGRSVREQGSSWFEV